MAIKQKSSIQSAVLTNTAYLLVVSRNIDGTAKYSLTDSNGSTVLTGNGFWDDASPWNTGTFILSPQDKGTQGQRGWMPWYIDSKYGSPSSDGIERTEITLHAGTSTASSHGCLAADPTFLNDMFSLIGRQQVKLVVSNSDPTKDYSVSLSLSAVKTTLPEGETTDVSVKLSRPISKPVYVAVESLNSDGLKSEDLIVLKESLTSVTVLIDKKLSTVPVVIIPAGSTESKFLVKAVADDKSEGVEKADIRIQDYAIPAFNQLSPLAPQVYRDGSLIKKTEYLPFNITDENITSGSINRSGGNGFYSYEISVKPGYVVSYSLEAYTVPDNLRIVDGSTMLVQTGFVSNLASGSFTVAPNTTGIINIFVEGNLLASTVWDLNVTYQGQSIVGAATLTGPITFASFGAGIADINGTADAAILAEASAGPQSALIVQSGVLSASGEIRSIAADIQAGHSYLAIVAPEPGGALDPTLKIVPGDGSPPELLHDMIGNGGTFAFVEATTDEKLAFDIGAERSTTGAFTFIMLDTTGRANTIYYLKSENSLLVETHPQTIEVPPQVLIVRDGDISKSATIKWAMVSESTSGITASDLAGGSLTGEVIFAPGEATRLVDVLALADGITEGGERFSFILTSVSDGVILERDVGELLAAVEFAIVDTPFSPVQKSGTPGADIIMGGPLDDTLSGGFSFDQIAGEDGDDVLSGDQGDDLLDGGYGLDTTVYKGFRAEYIVTTDSGVTEVRDLVQDRDGTDYLINTELLRFGDGTLLRIGNQAPTATADSAAVDNDQTLSKFALLANDTDPESDSLSITAVNGAPMPIGVPLQLPSGGRLTVNADFTVTYAPNTAFDFLAGGQTATETFTYTISDGQGHTATASADITVTGSGPGPIDPTFTEGPDTVTLTRPGGTWQALGGDDRVEGTPGIDVIHGNGGRDTIFGNGGADQLFGDEGLPSATLTGTALADAPLARVSLLFNQCFFGFAAPSQAQIFAQVRYIKDYGAILSVDRPELPEFSKQILGINELIKQTLLNFPEVMNKTQAQIATSTWLAVFDRTPSDAEMAFLLNAYQPAAFGGTANATAIMVSNIVVNYATVFAGELDIVWAEVFANTFRYGSDAFAVEDVLVGGAGDDLLSGGSGRDLAAFSGSVKNYVFRRNSTGDIIVDHVGGERSDGTDTTREIEYYKFADAELTFAKVVTLVGIAPADYATLLS